MRSLVPEIVGTFRQAIVTVLLRIHRHVSRPSDYYHERAFPDSYIVTLSSSMFTGMMAGAVGCGTRKSTPFSHPDHTAHSHQGSDLMDELRS